jgi:hypothetical protein
MAAAQWGYIQDHATIRRIIITSYRCGQYELPVRSVRATGAVSTSYRCGQGVRSMVGRTNGRPSGHGRCLAAGEKVMDSGDSSISRAEAIQISRRILDKAERERIEAAEQEAERGMNYRSIYILLSKEEEVYDEKTIRSVHSTREAAEAGRHLYKKTYIEEFEIDEVDYTQIRGRNFYMYFINWSGEVNFWDWKEFDICRWKEAAGEETVSYSPKTRILTEGIQIFGFFTDKQEATSFAQDELARTLEKRQGS